MSDEAIQTGPRGGQFVETSGGKKRYVAGASAAANKMDSAVKDALTRLSGAGWKPTRNPAERTPAGTLKTHHEGKIDRIRALPESEQRAACAELAKQTQMSKNTLLPEGGKNQKWLEGDDNKDAWRVANKDTTWAKYYPEGSKPGDPKAECTDPVRKVMQEEAKKLFVGSKSLPKPGEKKIAILMMGGPGSGKTSSLPASFDYGTVVLAAADDLKLHLPEFRDGVTAKSMRSAGIAHEESSAMAKQLVDQAITEGRHVLMDGTGATRKTYDDAITRLKAEGYEIHLNFVHLPYEKALPRIFSRAEKCGRFVPLDDAERKHDEVPANFEYFAKQVHSAKMFDNDVPIDTPMREVLTYKNGSSTVIDEQFVETFRKRYPQG